MTFVHKDWKDANSATGGGDVSTPLSAAAMEDLEDRLAAYTDLRADRLVLDVQDVGAVGNGSTNDMAAISSAIQTASAAGGGVVYLSPTPTGAGYACDMTSAANFIQVRSNVILLGSGYAGRLVRTGTFEKDTGHWLLKGPTASGAVVNFTMRDVHIDGKASTVALGSTTLSAGVTAPQATISLTNASGFPNTGTVMITGIVGQINYTGKSGNNLTGCTGGTGTVSAGAAVAEGIQNFAYRTFRLETISTGAATTPVHQNIRIENNTIDDWPGGCIDLHDTNVFAVNGNHLLNPRRGGIILWYDNAYGTVSGNTVSAGLDDCIAVQSNSNANGNAGGTGTHHVAITGNTFIEGDAGIQGTNNCISIQGGYNYSIVGNVADNMGTGGINKAVVNLDQSDGASPIPLTRVLVAGNIIRQSGNAYGVRIVGAAGTCADISIQTNRISNTQKEAIRVENVVERLSIQNNMIADANRTNTAATSAVLINAAVNDWLIEGNTITDSTGYCTYGINVASGTTDGAVLDNFAPDADFTTGGIHVNPAVPVIPSNQKGAMTLYDIMSFIGALSTTNLLQTKATGDAVNRFTFRADGRLSWGDGTNAQDAVFARQAADQVGTNNGDSLTVGTGVSTGNYIQMFEQTGDPAAPAANGARIYCKDNGAGKTQVGVLFNTGVFIPFVTQA